MARRARVDRTLEEKLEIVLQGMKSGNIAETWCRYEVAPNLYCRWKDEDLQGATAALGGRSAAAVENEKDRRIRQRILQVPVMIGSYPVHRSFRY